MKMPFLIMKNLVFQTRHFFQYEKNNIALRKNVLTR